MVDNIGDLPVYFSSDVDDYFDHISTHKVFLETDAGSTSKAGDCLVIAMALERLPKSVPTLGSAFVDLVRNLLVDINVSSAA